MTVVEDITTKRISRRTLFKGAGAIGLAVIVAPEIDYATAGKLRQAAAASESISDIVNVAATAEALAVTLLGGAIDSAMKGNYDKTLPDAVVAIFQAARSEEQYHLNYLESAGAKPLTQTFTIPDPKLLTSTQTLLTTVVSLETAFVAAYMAAAREFSAMNHTDLAKVAYQVGCVEAEHRVLANYALGTRPANDVAFEKAMFNTVGDAASTLKQLGFIGGSGTKVNFSGPGSVDNSNVIETSPGGPSVNCTVPGMPDTGGGGMASAMAGSGGGDGLRHMLDLLGIFGVGGGAIAMVTRRMLQSRASDQPDERR